MIGYVTIGSNDLDRAGQFYDALLGVIGAKRITDAERYKMWGTSDNGPSFCVIKPFNGEAATPGNGNMVSFALDAPEKVDALYKKALELGGTDEGPAGPRGEGGFYAGYFRDLEGNKLCGYCMVAK